jgi:hypothetical protein
VGSVGVPPVNVVTQGLALTNALGVTGLLSWGVRCLAESEAMMSSVERVQQLMEQTPQEAPEVVVAITPPPAPEVRPVELPHHKGSVFILFYFLSIFARPSSWPSHQHQHPL